MRMVDVVVGGQYGDEGKGRIALFLANHIKYAKYARVGGQNAEHRVQLEDGRTSVHHVLPVGSVSQNPGPTCILTAGMTFGLEMLEREIEQVRELVGRAPRVMVDRNAAIVTSELIEAGREAAEKRGSTFLGVGATMAAKVRRAGGCPIAADVGEDLRELHVGTVNAAKHLQHTVHAGRPVLIESSQGTMLSLDHGHYPHCTSRNMTAPGAISDAGLNHTNVRNVIMVVKAVPTRVPGNSGPTGGKELTWEEVCLRAGRPYEEIHQTPGGVAGAGDGAGGVERPFSVSLRELDYAAKLNGATHVALTFLDWWRYDDLGKTSWAHLSDRSKMLVRDVETACQAPVFFIGTGPNYADFILRKMPGG